MIIALLSVFWACSESIIDKNALTEDVGVVEQQDILKNANVKDIDNVLEDYARILAGLMENSEIKSVIKTEAQKMFDGDYDILVSDFETKKLGSEEKVIAEFIKEKKCETDLGFGQLKREMRNMQISVPVNCDEWDVEKCTPLVAFLPLRFDDKKDKEIKAYDSEGNVHILDATVTPKEPVVVVSISERVDAYGKLRYVEEEECIEKVDMKSTIVHVPRPTGFTASYSSAQAGFIELDWDDIPNADMYDLQWSFGSPGSAYSDVSIYEYTGDDSECTLDRHLLRNRRLFFRVRASVLDGGNLNWSNFCWPQSIVVSERKNNEPLYLKKFKFDNLSEYEGWINGRPEIRLRVVQGFSNGENELIKELYYNPKRSKVNDNWYTVDAKITNFSNDNTVLTFFWIEEDNGGNEDYKIPAFYEYRPFTNDSHFRYASAYEFTGNTSDDHIMTVKVLHWDAKSHEYTNDDSDAHEIECQNFDEGDYPGNGNNDFHFTFQ